MKALKTTVAAFAAILALVAALAVPAFALADDATPTPPPSTVTTPAPAPHPGKKLIARYRKLANLRLAAFNADANLLRYRITRLQTVATRVAKAGGDVTAIRSQLSTASAELYQARQKAKIAAADLRLVPFASNRTAALAAANAEWKSARAELKLARADKIQAAKALWVLVKQFKVKHIAPSVFS